MVSEVLYPYSSVWNLPFAYGFGGLLPYSSKWDLTLQYVYLTRCQPLGNSGKLPCGESGPWDDSLQWTLSLATCCLRPVWVIPGQALSCEVIGHIKPLTEYSTGPLTLCRARGWFRSEEDTRGTTMFTITHHHIHYHIVIYTHSPSCSLSHTTMFTTIHNYIYSHSTLFSPSLTIWFTYPPTCSLSLNIMFNITHHQVHPHSPSISLLVVTFITHHHV